jgi:hypothetical protein
VPTLVLQTAVSLTEAEKGILLSRDDDGDLEVTAHSGFDEDPSLDRWPHRFGGEALERDKTLREEDLLAIPIYIRDEMNGVIVCVNEEGDFKGLEDEVLLALGDHAGAILQNARLHGELRGSYLATVTMLAEAIQAKDPFLRGHSEEVSAYVGAVAERAVDRGLVARAARVRLAPARRGQDRDQRADPPQARAAHARRSTRSSNCTRGSATGCSSRSRRCARSPRRSSTTTSATTAAATRPACAGEQIPLEARIVSVADAFSAMTADRPYRQRMSLEDACAELERSAGTQFDPEIVRIFCSEVRKAPPDSGDR